MTNGHLALSLPWSAEQIHEDTEGLHEKEIFTFGSLAYVSCMKSVVAYILLFFPSLHHTRFSIEICERV